MAKNLFIRPYKKFSGGAKLLAKLLNAKLRYLPTGGLVVNWGNHAKADVPMLNPPEAVALASNKLSTFQALDGEVTIVPWTTDKTVAEGWLKAGKRVIARSLLRASEGRGITVVGPQDVLPTAKLYTQYVPKKKEFRVHVVGDAVIDIQEKRKKDGHDSSFIRSHDNAYVFCRGNIVEPKGLREICIKAVKTLGLDFGGVDIIWNEKQDKCYILEINTAPGLTNTTAKSYAAAFSKFLKGA